jgi:peptide/nickel transport system permease protein
MISNVGVTLLLLMFLWLSRRALRTPLWAEAGRRMRRKPIVVAACVVVGLYGMVAVSDSYSWSSGGGQAPKTVLDRLFERPQERTYSAPLATLTSEASPKPVVAKHIFGTDGVGNDVLYRTLKGVRTAFLIGGLTILIVLPIAISLGMVAGYHGRLVDDTVQYVYTVLDSIPGILLLIAIMMILGQGVPQLCVALGVTSWVGLCRLVRGETLKQRDREYVLAARALGLGTPRIMVRHILPNLMPIVIVSATLGFSGLVLSEAILSYLGVGVPEDVGSWGNMIEGARMELAREPVIWWNLVSASTALFFLVLALNILGDALRDAIDPRLRGGA